MKIKYIKGDLFKTENRVILHGCNAQGVMGSGVARIIRDDYTEAYEHYKQCSIINGLELGSINHCESNHKLIINAITQKYYGRDGKRYVSYDAVSGAMKETKSLLNAIGENKISMPMIGSGLGGGDWNVIAAIIESELKMVEPYVYVLE